MAQVIAPETWQQGIRDPKKLPTKFTPQIFTGKGVNIANNESACRVWDYQLPDFVTTYDDRRINGLANFSDATDFNTDGRDGWGASAWGPFQEVRFDSRVYTMGRHRSCAFRIFAEKQYSGGIGEFGDATHSNYSHAGNALMNDVQIISAIKSEYEDRVLGVDMDKYNLFAVCNGHIAGRLVGISQEYEDKVFDGDAAHYTWVAQPGPVQGQAIPPRFAPIQCMQFDIDNALKSLAAIRTAWKTVGVDESNCIICMDQDHEFDLMTLLTGNGVPATANAYQDLQKGEFKQLMGFNFYFEIPTSYYPQIYVDANLNVVHSADGTAAYDKVINSVSGTLREKLIASHRMGVNNFVRRVWDKDSKTFKMIVTNYPLGDIGAIDYYGDAVQVPIENYGKPETYPWSQPGAGYGLPPYDGTTSGTATGPVGDISKVRVIGLAVDKTAAQLSQYYSEAREDDGGVRAKCKEFVMDVKYDAWVIESKSAGIIPIISVTSSGDRAIPVTVVGGNVTIDNTSDNPVPTKTVNSNEVTEEEPVTVAEEAPVEEKASKKTSSK